MAAALLVLRAEAEDCSVATARRLVLGPLAGFECQIAPGSDAFAPAAMNGLAPWPLPAAICSRERPEATDLSSLVTSSLSRANSSRCLINNQLLRFPCSRSCLMRT